MKTDIACAFALAALASASPLLMVTEAATKTVIRTAAAGTVTRTVTQTITQTATEAATETPTETTTTETVTETVTETATQKRTPLLPAITRVKQPPCPTATPAAIMNHEVDDADVGVDEKENEGNGYDNYKWREPKAHEQLCWIPEGCRVLLGDKTITIPAGKHFPSELVHLPSAGSPELPRPPPRKTVPPVVDDGGPSGTGDKTEGYVQHTPTKPAFPPDEWPVGPEETGAAGAWDWDTFPRDKYPEDDFVPPTDVPAVQKRQLIPGFLWRPKDAVDGDNDVDDEKDLFLNDPEPDSDREAGPPPLIRGRPAKRVPLKGDGVQDFFFTRTRAAATAQATPQATPAAGGEGEREHIADYPWWDLGLTPPGPVVPDGSMELPEASEAPDASDAREGFEKLLNQVRGVFGPEYIDYLQALFDEKMDELAEYRQEVALDAAEERGPFKEWDEFHKDSYWRDEDDE
ncbi:hypothetical protein VPNG_02866 [Cytospora leucostoma]|uniref:Uncharacterized protein n=1 Tax=Cytospora leucostoma TaxID=1230097 RepID=A0A423XJ85_9PEZI|nr:hypothetical protein VPNG_02866 [Cytospora leucostoma]